MSIVGLGFWISLGLAVLEVFGFISIGWWLVLAPFLVAIGVTFAIWLVAFIVAILIAAITSR